MEDHTLKPVKHLKIKEDMKVSELVKGMKGIGFGARKIGEASEIFKEMTQDDDCKVFFGLAGAMVPGGMRQIIVDLLKSGKINVFVTTGANLTHDLIEALGHHHFQGSEKADDEELRK